MTIEIPIHSRDGKQTGTMSIDPATLGGEVNPALLKQAFVMYHANHRQGSARTKGKSSVEGSTRKLYRQKGTGNARMGQVRTPIRRGGGVTFAKKRTSADFRQEMPVKMRRKANRNALLAKLVDGEVKVVESLDFDAPKTRAASDMLKALGVDRSCVLACKPGNLNLRLAARTIDDVTLANAEQLTCWELLNSRFLVIAKQDLQEWLDGPSSKTDKSASRQAKTEQKQRPVSGNRERRKQRREADRAARAGKPDKRAAAKAAASAAAGKEGA